MAVPTASVAILVVRGLRGDVGEGGDDRDLLDVELPQPAPRLEHLQSCKLQVTSCKAQFVSYQRACRLVSLYPEHLQRKSPGGQDRTRIMHTLSCAVNGALRANKAMAR